MPFEIGKEFKAAHLSVTAIPVNHIVPTVGLLVSDGDSTVAFSSDTAETKVVLPTPNPPATTSFTDVTRSSAGVWRGPSLRAR